MVDDKFEEDAEAGACAARGSPTFAAGLAVCESLLGVTLELALSPAVFWVIGAMGLVGI